MPYIFIAFFIASCVLFAIITGTPVYMPLVFSAMSITMCFFLSPHINVWLTALTNISLLLFIFVYPNAIERFLPLPVFILTCVVFDFAMISMIILVYTFRRKMNLLQHKLTAAVRENSRKSAFMESAAHEIQTPINTINDLCLLLLRGEISKEAREHTYAIQAARKNITDIIENTFDYSELEAHRLKIVSESYDFGSFLSDIVNLCSNKIENEKVDFIVECAPDIPKILIGDSARISQIVMNIFSNAVRYTKSGRITLTLSSRKTEDGIVLRISVKDTGTGIAPSRMKKIFRVFSENDGESKLYSTHLGLGISKRLVTLMGGFINAESAVGKGSTFSAAIPQRVADEQPFITINSRENICVLMFLEKASCRDAMERIFSSIGVCMTWCASQTEFMTKKENSKYTHIIADYSIFNFNRPIFDILSQRVEIIVPRTNLFSEEKTPHYVRSVLYPLYAASLVPLFNYGLCASGGTFTVSFAAPDAAVLIVDESSVGIKIAGSILKPYGVSVFSADNSFDALEIVNSRRIDLVFDAFSPLHGDRAIAGKIRSLNDEYYKKLPIVAVTADTEQLPRGFILEKGYDDCITKPIRLCALEQLLKKWLPRELISELTEPVEIITSEELSEKKYTNFDPNVGIMNSGGNREAYYDILEAFFEAYDKTRSELDNALHERDSVRFGAGARSLRYAAKSIGAERLSEFARQLEVSTKRNEYVLLSERLPVVYELIEATNADIAMFFANNDIRLRKKPDFATALTAVNLAIEKNDAAAAKAVLEELLESRLSDTCRRHAEKALGYINNFNFSGAAKESRRLGEASREVI